MKLGFILLLLLAQIQPYTNRLATEKSPYLQLHAHNPVDWYPWGEEAFTRARRENKPILLSVGYSSCHWCHVMERESFSDPEIAEIMNRYFISIKVDREERPDVDRVYLTFIQLTTGGSGYPMTLFLTPDLKPIFGGTYFPKVEGNELPAFRNILTKFADAWETDRANVLQAASSVTDSMHGYVREQASGNSKLAASTLTQTYARLQMQYDRTYGGFGNKPKFPQPVVFNFLLRHYSRTGQRDALNMTLNTLKKIAEGGIRDHLGGGFFRYSTDERWQVPHFEKMLYDQALLTSSYLDAYQITKDRFYADVARETLKYVIRDMQSPQGGFHSAEDADSLFEHGSSENGEGAFYVWKSEEVVSVLGGEAASIFSFYYGIEPGGNIPADQDIQGQLKEENVLYVHHSLAETAARFRKSPKEITDVLNAARNTLYTARNQRPRPPKDDKVLTAWNGLMISTLSRAAQVLDDPAYAARATAAASFLKSNLSALNGQGLHRRYRDSQAGIDGFLEDYAFLIQGLLDLYETTFDLQWLNWAVQLQEKQDQLFWDSGQGAYFATSGLDTSILFRMRDEYDGAEPSANSIAAMNLLRLSQVTGRQDWQEKATRTFSAFSNRVLESPDVLPQLVAALNFSLSKPKQIIIAGKPNAPDTHAILRQVHNRYLPNKFLLIADGADAQRQISRWLPFFDSIRQRNGKATAYICENYVCKLPTSDLKVIARLLDEK